MKSQRVLLTTYQSAFLRPAGGESELEKLADSLTSLGIETDIYGVTSSRIEAYDLVLHFSVQSESLDFLKTIRSLGKKVILWPNLWWNYRPSPETAFKVEAFLGLSDAVIFKSKSELYNMQQYANLNRANCRIVPWQIDESYASDADSKLFKSMYNLDRYILWVGVIEESKNQLAAIRSLKNIDIPLVFIGSQRDERYFKSCRQEASANVLFIPTMEPGSEILRSAYKGSTAYIEISKEPAGLSALEAATFAKPMVLSNNPWSQEHFGTNIALVDPDDELAIQNAVEMALKGNYKFKGKSEILEKHLSPECLRSLATLIREII